MESLRGVVALLPLALGCGTAHRGVHRAAPPPAIAAAAPVVAVEVPAVSVPVLVTVASPGPGDLPTPTSLGEILAHDDRADVRRLRARERFVLWTPTGEEGVEPSTRVSLFVLDDTGWRYVGDAGSRLAALDASVARIEPDGVAILVEAYTRDEEPRTRVHAVALVDGRIVTADSGEVAAVDADGGAAAPEVIVWRHPDGVDPAVEWPLRASELRVRRTERGLALTEEPLTPWVDVLAAFCTGAHPELADAAVRASVERCGGFGPTLRWTRHRDVVATLGLRMRCGGAEGREEAYTEDVDNAQLVLRQRPGGWRIVSARGCEGSP